jgi:hypothetical protein
MPSQPVKSVARLPRGKRQARRKPKWASVRAVPKTAPNRAICPGRQSSRSFLSSFPFRLFVLTRMFARQRLLQRASIRHRRSTSILLQQVTRCETPPSASYDEIVAGLSRHRAIQKRHQVQGAFGHSTPAICGSPFVHHSNDDQVSCGGEFHVVVVGFRSVPFNSLHSSFLVTPICPVSAPDC